MLAVKLNMDLSPSPLLLLACQYNTNFSLALSTEQGPELGSAHHRSSFGVQVEPNSTHAQEANLMT